MGEHSNPNTERKIRTTRAILGALALVIAAYDMDVSASVIANPPTSNSITNIEHSSGAGFNVQKTRTSDTVTIVISGLGVQSGENIARSLDPSLGKDSDVSYLKYSSNELDVVDIKHKIINVYKDGHYKNLRVYCHSIGGIIFTNLEKELINMGINITLVMLDGSPDGADSVRGLGRIVTKMESVVPIGGYFTEYGVQLYEWTIGSEKRPQNSLSYQMGDAWRVTNDDNSPRTWASMLAYLEHNKVEDLEQISNVPTYYIVPANIRDDNVVDNVKAIEGYRKVNINFEVISVKSRRHASPTVYSYEYNQVIMKILADSKKTPDAQESSGMHRNLLK